jgi:hypothetical protein
MNLLIWALAPSALFTAVTTDSPTSLETRECRIQIDGSGSIDSMVSRRSGTQYSPVGHTSPLLSLNIKDQLVSPTSAFYDAKRREFKLGFPQGSVAVVKAVGKDRYFRFQLLSLTNREEVDDVVWGPVHTTISKLIGDLLGVVRDGNWAIGMLGLDDNTIAGPPTPGECYGMRYYVHSPDPIKYPVPAQYKEGQWFNIGGDGVNDVAFYSHPEEYFQLTFGTGATLEPDFGSSLAYHSRDRRKSYSFVYSLLPGFKGSRPRHEITDPFDADYIGSGIALYSCPDNAGLSTIEHIELAEGLPHPMIDGKWIHDPAGLKPSIMWSGRHDKLIEYADALGMKAVHDEGQGEYYANPADHWLGDRVKFSGGKSMTYRQFTDETNAHGIKYGLHTLCLFLQSGRCTDVTPNASEHLQTVLRTKLAKDISAQDTAITVTDPSYLSEDGTWPMRDGSNTLRIGTELIHYDSITGSRPFTLNGIKRGFDGTLAQPHQAHDEVAKLQMNCYDGFCPDLNLMLAYADYYATVMSENGMRYIDFDGLESTLYQSQGYFGVRRFFRRFFDTYAKLTGGLAPRVMGSCVFAGGWDYMSVCDVGGGNNMFDPILNRWGIEGKDIRYGFGNSYFAPTLGGQDLHSDWSVYDAENIQAKAIGWNATFVLGLSEDAVERCGEKQGIFRAFRTWEDARESGVFTDAVKTKLRDLDYKFHLEQTGNRSFLLTAIKEVRLSEQVDAAGKDFALHNSFDAQPLQFSIQFAAPIEGCVVSLPNGSKIECGSKIEAGQFIIGKGTDIYLADKFRKKLIGLSTTISSLVPRGASSIVVLPSSSKTNVGVNLTVWYADKPVKIKG